MSRPRLAAASALALPALLGAIAIVPPAGATDVRPYVCAGPTIPVGMPEMSRGFGVGVGMEAETSKRVRAVLRIDMHRMPVDNPIGYVSPSGLEVTAFTWSLGARAYLVTHGPIRPYADGGVAMRAGGRPDWDGLAMVMRLGISTAQPGGPGIFLDAGRDLWVEGPDRPRILTARLGVVLP
ncbi:MAG: hypothetical protein ACRENJ_12160 [Candidatus Eiseniibacteriota bacterium]